MKAAVLNAFGDDLVIGDRPDPVIGTGEVVVDVVATRVLAYMAEVLSGKRRYLLELPAIPGSGAIGRVVEIGPDATHLKPGDWVYCDPTVRSRDGSVAPDIVLQGLSARDEGGLRLQRYHRDGSFAQKMRVPTENAVAIGEIDEAAAASWCALGTLLVPFGGWLAADLKPGETVVVSGATGAFGAAAVAVALAMGAGRVIATGRNAITLTTLESRFGARVTGVAMRGDEEEDRARILAAAAGPIDCVFDILPPEASAAQARTAIMAVRAYGRVVLMGGVGMLGGDDLALPYPWIMRNCVTIHGVWMYPPDAPAKLVKMIRAGLVDLDQYETVTFALDDVAQALAHAAANAGPFAVTILRP